MTKSIVPVLTQEELLDLFRRETKIDGDGKVEFSRRGAARLVGKDKATIRNLLKNLSGGRNLSLELEDYSGHQFSPGEDLPDFLVSAIIAHYAFKGDLHCRRLDKITRVAGLRASVHKANNWTSSQSPQQQLVWQYVLDTPRPWTMQFPPEYYQHLARITRIYPEGTNRPHLWGNLTNEFVYDLLPKEVQAGLREAKDANAPYQRLHQFLKPDGLEMLQNHLNALMVLMSGVATLTDLRKAVQGRFTGCYQLSLTLKPTTSN
jgi:hypothetical protein